MVRTDRLLLRPFGMGDAPDVQRLAGSYDVAKGTLVIPHPYPEGEAERWIASLRRDEEAGTLVNFAIVLQAEDRVIGSIGLDIAAAHRHARMSYWLGQPYWNRGYGTEAVQALLAYGFQQLHLHRIYAPHFLNNPASGRVLQKAGMRYEGRLREHYVRFGQSVDVELYGLLEQEFDRR
ncbi:MAG: GNAT family N-acetyltransferase [Nitrospira sp.]|jgi:ribosomal-protein-alanine N-acetyltransferase|nr:GNAT family N-acetyltransferase [Nitrospira sp.]